MFKTENAIYKDIIEFVNKSLMALDIKGWSVRQLKQPLKVTVIEPTLYVTCTLRRRRGWQYTKDKPLDDLIKHSEKFKQEIDVQFSALRARKVTDDFLTQNSSDILEMFKTYLLSKAGLNMLQSKGYQIYQPSEIQSPDFFNDSDNFEFMPFFTVTFIIEQSLETTIQAISTVKFKQIKGV